MANQGPFMGTVMWPQAERSCCLFAEGGKTALRTIDSASPWCSLLSSQCLPWLPSSDYARWWAWNKPGGSSGSSAHTGLESRSKDAQERAWASEDGCCLSPKGGETSGRFAAHSMVLQPLSQVTHSFLPGTVSLFK